MDGAGTLRPGGRRMRILVTGAAGQVGTELPRYLDGHEVVALDRRAFDVTAAGDVDEVVGALRPDAVVNCSAYNAVDAAETDEAGAMAVNRDGPTNLAEAAGRVGAHFVHLSTDYVFPGDATSPYTEDSEPGPLSVYGRSKLAGEEAVRHGPADWAIVRTAWVFGRVGRSLVETIVQRGLAGDPLRMVDDQTGSPTYAADLAAVLARIVTCRLEGLFHVTNDGQCTPYQLTLDVLARAGATDPDVERITSAELGRPAPRPAYSALQSVRLAPAGIPPLRHYRAALDEVVPELAARARGVPRTGEA